jgi:hypothetical protein
LLGTCWLLLGCSAKNADTIGESAQAPSAGGGGTPAVSASPNGGASTDTGGSPVVSAAIDFRFWELQLPIGAGSSPDTVSSAELLKGFSNEYFYRAADGGQAFMDPATGITTSGSQHCRTELREQASGAGKAAWSSLGTHRLTVEGKVVQLGRGNVAVGQLFNGTDSIPLCELQYTSQQRFSLLYEEAKGAGSSTDLSTPVALDERYTFALAMVDGQVSVSINGKEVYSHTPSPAILANQFYFKFGNYDQSSIAGTPTTTPYSIVEAYRVEVVHQ